MKKMMLSSSWSLNHMNAIEELYKGVTRILFIPNARPGGISFEEYTQKIKPIFAKLGKEVKGLHEFLTTEEAFKNTDGIFVGGGNTFCLVYDLYKHGMVPLLQDSIDMGKPYLGISAGANIAGITMGNTNDMPIVHVPSYTTIGAVPFNINPHYFDAQDNPNFKGETRDDRIKEFHAYNVIPVVAIREGAWIRVDGYEYTVCGTEGVKIFNSGAEEVNINPGERIRL